MKINWLKSQRQSVPSCFRRIALVTCKVDLTLTVLITTLLCVMNIYMQWKVWDKKSSKWQEQRKEEVKMGVKATQSI